MFRSVVRVINFVWLRIGNRPRSESSLVALPSFSLLENLLWKLCATGMVARMDLETVSRNLPFHINRGTRLHSNPDTCHVCMGCRRMQISPEIGERPQWTWLIYLPKCILGREPFLPQLVYFTLLPMAVKGKYQKFTFSRQFCSNNVIGR